MSEKDEKITRYESGDFTGERSLFCLENAYVAHCYFHDGESPLKEGVNLEVKGCKFQWKYPIWYGKGHKVTDCTFVETARSGIWYTHESTFQHCHFLAPKYFRRCHDILIENSKFPLAQETLWTCHNVTIRNCQFEGDYLLKDSSNVTLENVTLLGNYLLDGGSNIVVRNCTLESKDAFWNCENVLIEDSTVIGEYFGWNSKNVMLRRCKVVSNQGFCYMENVTLEGCYLEGTDLSFEYSSGKAKVLDEIDSVKNPNDLILIAKGVKEMILDENREEGAKLRYTNDLNKGFDDEF